MEQPKPLSSWWRTARGYLIAAGMFVAVMGIPVYTCASLAYTETKGPFKNWMQVVDWEGDGDLDTIVSHTRWEAVDISWAGIGLWVNQGDGTFVLHRDRGTGGWPFGGYAAGAGDVDQDGDLDVLTKESGIRLLANQGGVQGREPGKYAEGGGGHAPPAHTTGYRDMGGTITMGDLNGDGRIDAFVSDCCYGMDATGPDPDFPYGPSTAWVWVNDGRDVYFQKGHPIPLDDLEGLPIRQAALGDVDGDGDVDVFAAVGAPTLGTVASPGALVLLNDGMGNLAASGGPLGAADSTSVALGDVNGDGHLDALVGTSAGAQLWLNNRQETGSGAAVFVPAEQTFAAARTIGGQLQAGFSAAGRLLGLYLPYGSLRTKAVFLADLDGDGDLDALLARLWGAEIWWNDGQGQFSRSELHFAYREDTGVAVADFDGDGDPDVFTGRNEDDYQVWWNGGEGVFTTGSP